MAGGRPSDCTDNLVAYAREYLDGGWKDQEEACPTIAGLAVWLKISRETVRDWAANPDRSELHGQFSCIVDELMATQELKLASGGLRGDMNASITKLLLSKHGYSDKVESEISGPGGGPIQTKTTFQFVGVNANTDTRAGQVSPSDREEKEG